MAVSPMKGITKATVTAKTGFTVNKNYCYKSPDGFVNGTIALLTTQTLAGGVWATIGNINFIPKEAFFTTFYNGYNGKYGGILTISSNGDIQVFPSETLSSANVVPTAVLAYLS